MSTIPNDCGKILPPRVISLNTLISMKEEQAPILEESSIRKPSKKTFIKSLKASELLYPEFQHEKRKSKKRKNAEPR